VAGQQPAVACEFRDCFCHPSMSKNMAQGSGQDLSRIVVCERYPLVQHRLGVDDDDGILMRDELMRRYLATLRKVHVDYRDHYLRYVYESNYSPKLTRHYGQERAATDREVPQTGSQGNLSLRGPTQTISQKPCFPLLRRVFHAIPYHYSSASPTATVPAPITPAHSLQPLEKVS
jgi:hypothetical protein